MRYNLETKGISKHVREVYATALGLFFKDVEESINVAMAPFKDVRTQILLNERSRNNFKYYLGRELSTFGEEIKEKLKKNVPSATLSWQASLMFLPIIAKDINIGTS